MRRGLYYVFILILAYLALVHFTGFSKDLGAGTNLFKTGVVALQGR